NAEISWLPVSLKEVEHDSGIFPLLQPEEGLRRRGAMVDSLEDWRDWVLHVSDDQGDELFGAPALHLRRSVRPCGGKQRHGVLTRLNQTKAAFQHPDPVTSFLFLRYLLRASRSASTIEPTLTSEMTIIM